MSQESAQLQMIHSSLSRERQFSVAHYQTNFRRSQDHSLSRTRGRRIEDVVVESEDHVAKGFWVCAYPLASKKALDMFAAIQTIVGQVNSEFQEDVTRMIRLGAVSIDGDPTWEIRGGQVREWSRTNGFQVTSIARGGSSNSSRAKTCRNSETNGKNNASRQWSAER